MVSILWPIIDLVLSWLSCSVYIEESYINLLYLWYNYYNTYKNILINPEDFMLPMKNRNYINNVSLDPNKLLNTNSLLNELFNSFIWKFSKLYLKSSSIEKT